MSDFDALPKHFDSAEVEGKWYALWEQAGCFDSAPSDEKENYSILLPPPNVTGTLHMGHAFQHTLMDALIRRERMKGRNVLWQAGTDHAGIATQIVVNRELRKKNIDPTQLSREEFLRHAWEWKEHSGNTITRQMRRLGASCDWARECFTMDENLSLAVTEAFVRLYEDGLIYRGKRLVNWDPQLLTAVSDLEVVSEEEDGMMYHVRYPFVDNESQGITIATTRPETILVDGAIAVHPHDERFRQIVGKHVWVPMTVPRRAIEIITDEHVDPEFGSGCVKITAAHDFNDYEVYCRHPDKNIPLIVLFTPQATMNDNAPARYCGLDRFDARRRIVEDLREEGLLLKEVPHRYKLPRGERSGTVVEPMLTNQWFVKTRDLANKSLTLVEDGELRFTPDNWRKVYEQWLGNIQDWCISRQIIWGHQIPAWYDNDGNVFVARNADEARAKSGGKNLRRESDVLDTWFSSALWPFSTMGWPQTNNAYYRHYFPSTVLVTGFDIIFFWVARMTMMSKHIFNKTPFHDVYITGLVRDSEGQKMSKSKGNILDPLDLVDGILADALVKKRISGLMSERQSDTVAAATRKQFPNGITPFGADALRFTFASLASYGRDIKFDLERCAGYRNFCNKIWNASRFVIGVCHDYQPPTTATSLDVVDAWIISRLQRCEEKVEKSFDIYRFDSVATAIHKFLWHDYCDWYLEIAKVRMRNGNPQERRATQGVLLGVLETVLRLCHPLIPFITEELWNKVAPLIGRKKTQFIMQAPYPQCQAEKINPEAEMQVALLIDIVTASRDLKRDGNIFAGSTRPTLLIAGDKEMLMPLISYIQALAGLSDVQWCDTPAIEKCVVRTSVGNFTLGLQCQVDKEDLRAKLQKNLQQSENELSTLRRMLDDPQFEKRAPATVVQKKQARVTELENRRLEIVSQLKSV